MPDHKPMRATARVSAADAQSASFYREGAIPCSDKKTATPNDPPEIKPWSAVGRVQIGSTAEHVRRVYGRPKISRKLNLPVMRDTR